MTTVSTEFLSRNLPIRTHLHRTWHPNPNTTTLVTLKTQGFSNNNKGHHHHHVSVAASSQKLDQDYDFRDPHLMKSLNRSCKAGKYNESLYFLQHMVSKGYKPDVILCTKLIKG